MRRLTASARMSFPFYFELFGVRLHPHLVFEGLGYFMGARLYFALRRRAHTEPLPLETNLWILVGCVFGAWAGSKLLAWAESPQFYLTAFHTDGARALLGGKTIVGGLLGGWAGVEIAKRACGIVRSTGDLFVYPLALGTAVGRIGCFLTGLPDKTYGVATTLPWGVDFGDGLARHPTQLYESLFVLTFATTLWFATRRSTLPPGALFRLYFVGYFAFRFTVEFIKTREPLLVPLSAIQLASLAGVALALITLRRLAPVIQNLPSKIQN
jgi:phosphatidylglycerol:prolipoprotein diacylglycerol transferase